MLDLIVDLSRHTGWTRTEVVSLGLSEAARIIERHNERASG